MTRVNKSMHFMPPNQSLCCLLTEPLDTVEHNNMNECANTGIYGVLLLFSVLWTDRLRQIGCQTYLFHHFVQPQLFIAFILNILTIVVLKFEEA